jgi:2-C-methyl-D-erythritol 2,4-cyclodiphosphate synthase
VTDAPRSGTGSGGPRVGHTSSSPRVGIGTDLHRLVEGRPLWLGTVAIPFTHGLLGHSDADVLCHAVADALLGAAALGEIGRLFPDTDPQWEGLAGALLLSKVRELLEANRWRIVNVDSVVQAQRPHLAPFQEAMAAGIAAALQIDASRVSVKIKSNESVGAIGRGEAIAASAIACVEPVGARVTD